MNYAQWRDFVHSIGGRATRWPFHDEHEGEPAAAFDTTGAYVDAFNAGHLPSGAGTQPSGSGTAYYVLGSAMAGASVFDGAPHTMTTTERIANTVFSTGDDLADKAGLPSLTGIEDFLKDTGKAIIGGVLVTVAIGAILKQRGRR